ncbi:hypothetical protein QTG54_001826 [Skeletonema marinoi]|uniref:Uncharacterized protein n=1 Tax=Skeletonema marinoi TaxID=267567 RepID=A0AAD8YK46_9STRA|nr:hypothetical protein QTG54_001826 [Skeletonema marinoi]
MSIDRYQTQTLQTRDGEPTANLPTISNIKANKTVLNMPRIVTAVAFSAIISLSNGKLIGDVVKEGLRGAQEGHRALSNEEILKDMLGKEVFSFDTDECLIGVDVNGTATYGRCEIRRFPYCEGDTPHICFNRVNRQDKFWPDKNPHFYIDYKRIHCYPDIEGFTCSSCSPGRWCTPEGRCILDENLYSCWDDE